jgi:hypothetical protein
MLWVGLVLVVLAVVLFMFARRSADKVHYVKATDTSTVGAIQKLVSEVAADMPDGEAIGFKDYVEVKGRVVCDEPIRGELSEQLGAIVETDVIRVAERREEVRDAHGHIKTTWRKHEETLSSNRREAAFWIDDGTGRLRVKPDRNVELIKSFERFENEGGHGIGFGGGQLNLSMGRYQLSVGGGHWDPTTSRTLGYRFIERLLPVGKPVYAIGEVAAIPDEGLVLRAPTDDQKKRPFVVSPRTEEEIVKSAEKSALFLKVGAALLAVGGLALVVVGLLR